MYNEAHLVILASRSDKHATLIGPRRYPTAYVLDIPRRPDISLAFMMIRLSIACEFPPTIADPLRG